MDANIQTKNNEFDCLITNNTVNRWQKWYRDLIMLLCFNREYEEDRQKNRYLETHMFHTARQEVGETIENFIARLQKLAKHCEFGAFTKNSIAAHVVSYCRSSKLQKKFLEYGDLDLEDIIIIARNFELSNEQQKILGAKSANHKKRSKRKPAKNQNEHFNKYNKDEFEPAIDNLCIYCGYDYPHKGICPAEGKNCKTCGKLNHFARVCSKSYIPSINKSIQCDLSYPNDLDATGLYE